MSISGDNDKNLMLFRSLKKLKCKDLFDLPSLISEITLLHQLLQRNSSQHHTRKYFRLSTQVHKKCSHVAVSLETLRKDLDAACLEAKDSFNHQSSFQCLLHKSKNLHEETSNIMGLSIKTLFELQRYLANCEFVKFLIALLSVISKLHSLISKANKVTKKIINLLSHDPCLSSKEIASHASMGLSCQSHSQESIDEVQPISNSEMTNWAEAEEDLGEIVTEQKLQQMPGNAFSLVQAEQVVTVSNLAPSALEETSFQSNSMSIEKEPTYNCKQGNNCCGTGREITCDVMKCVKSGKKKNIIVKKPAYKVYKERHPFIRKLARYSSDMLRTEIPDYSLSLYTSL